MAMDVIGNIPSSPLGKSFHKTNSAWFPLWAYCEEVFSKCKEINGYVNDGRGLNDADAFQLAVILHREIQAGRTAEYAAAQAMRVSKLPNESCQFCHGTGQRTDAIGLKTRARYPDFSCNGCRGEGNVRPLEANYRFSLANAVAFADFLETCGGFKIL